jgi:hypothetical protein
VIIDIREARRRAEKVARFQLDPFVKDGQEVLTDEYEEAKNCWFFFRNRKIFGSAENALRWDWAYAVSK